MAYPSLRAFAALALSRRPPAELQIIAARVPEDVRPFVPLCRGYACLKKAGRARDHGVCMLRLAFLGTPMALATACKVAAARAGPAALQYTIADLAHVRSTDPVRRVPANLVNIAAFAGRLENIRALRAAAAEGRLPAQCAHVDRSTYVCAIGGNSVRVLRFLEAEGVRPSITTAMVLHAGKNCAHDALAYILAKTDRERNTFYEITMIVGRNCRECSQVYLQTCSPEMIRRFFLFAVSVPAKKAALACLEAGAAVGADAWDRAIACPGGTRALAWALFRYTRSAGRA